MTWLKDLLAAIFGSKKTEDKPSPPAPKPVEPLIPVRDPEPDPLPEPPKKKAPKKSGPTPEFEEKLRGQLGDDEGIVYYIYIDHLGLQTFGIGHLITKDDPEYGKPLKTAVSSERVHSAFSEDIKTSYRDCEELFDNFWELPEEVRLICCNMAFNMGRTRLSKFKNFIAAVNADDWVKAAAEMKDSRWYRQVTNRAERLRKRMESVA